jgi:hypothetical protein
VVSSVVQGSSLVVSGEGLAVAWWSPARGWVAAPAVISGEEQSRLLWLEIFDFFVLMRFFVF